jgi:hypothetical protein
LPAVARATAVCFLRCECLRGRGVGRPRDPSHRWDARFCGGEQHGEGMEALEARRLRFEREAERLMPPLPLFVNYSVRGRKGRDGRRRGAK